MVAKQRPNRRYFSIATLMSSVIAAAHCPPAQAQSAASSAAELQSEEQTHVLDEVIVTARRREESLQEVPVAVDVLDSKSLEQRQIVNVADLAQASPGLSAFNRSGGAVFSMRGQGAAWGGSEPGVVTYLAEAAEFSPFVYDLANVQVLRGPQGTLFGRNTTGGVILLTPQKPTDEFGGYVTARVGSYSQRETEFAVGGPMVADTLSFRIAGQILRRDGYTKNLSSGNRLDDEDRESFRASLLWRPFAGVENHTLFQYDNIDENGPNGAIIAYANTPATPYLDQLGPYLELQHERGPRKVENYDPEGIDTTSRSRGLINTTTWNVTDQVTLKNIYRYSKTNISGVHTDLDGSPFRLVETVTVTPPRPSYTKSDEVQMFFDPTETINFVAGAYYENISPGSSYTIARLSLAAPTPIPLDIHLKQGKTGESKAGFLHGTWEFVPDWTLAMGFRRTSDERTADQSQDIGVFGTISPLTPRAIYELKSKANTWNVSLNHQFNSGLMAYGSVRRGYKAGGFTFTNDPDRVRYGPEYVTSHEVGLKSEWKIADVVLRVNGDVFFDSYKDIQRNLVQPSIPPTTITQNAAKAKIRGLDVDLLLATTQYFEASLKYTYLKTKYQEYEDPSLGDLSDGDFPNTPKHQLSFTPAFTLPLGENRGSLFAQTALFYQSKFVIDPNNVLNGNALNDLAVPGSRRPSITRLDARLDWNNIMGHPLSAGFYVRNVTDKVYQVGGSNTLSGEGVGVAMTTYGEPRLYSFVMRYDF